jgi:hypothetical protein
MTKNVIAHDKVTYSIFVTYKLHGYTRHDFQDRWPNAFIVLDGWWGRGTTTYFVLLTNGPN